MKKILFIFLITFNFLYANSDLATKGDVNSIKSELVEIRRDMRENNRMLLEVIKTNQENTNKRFEDVNRRFDDVNKRFEFIQNLLALLTTAIFGLIGYMFWDRKQTIKDAKEEFSKIVEDKLRDKADKNALEKVLDIIEEIAKKDENVREALKRHHLSYQG